MSEYSGKYSGEYNTYKQGYNAEHYKRMVIDCPPDLLEEFKETCKRNKRSMADIVKEFMREYIDDNQL